MLKNLLKINYLVKKIYCELKYLCFYYFIAI